MARILRTAAQTLQYNVPSIDAIQEFSVLRSLYPAESGRSAGGQVNVITKAVQASSTVTCMSSSVTIG
jgi:hypothetical protein